MSAYVSRRILSTISKIFGILLVLFAIVQFAPGGSMARLIAKFTANGGDATSVFRVESY